MTSAFSTLGLALGALITSALVQYAPTSQAGRPAAASQIGSLPATIAAGWQPVNDAPGPVVAGMDGSPASQTVLSFAFEEAALRDVPLVALCALADAPGVLGGAREMEEHFTPGDDR